MGRFGHIRIDIAIHDCFHGDEMTARIPISVVCPTYNSSSFVLRALESIAGQSYQLFKVIVSDDGSTDDTVEVVTQFFKERPEIDAEVLVGLHHGPGAARNAGIERCKTDWIAFIDSDDVWSLQKLEKVADAIAANPEANLFCHNEERIRKDGSRVLLDFASRYKADLPLGVQLFHTNLFTTSAVTCRRSLLCQAGLFDVTFMSGQDYELWFRMAPWARPYFLNDLLGYYYDRPGNITSGSFFKQWKNLVRVAIRHRDKATLPGFLYRLARLTASFGARGVWRKAGFHSF